MKKVVTALLVLFTLFTFMIAPANAAFFGRLETSAGSGIYQAYYDDQLDITWTANANINSTDTWANQVAWAAGLTIDSIGGWRLPNMDINGDDDILACSLDQAACKDNEYGHLFYYGAGMIFGSGITSSSPGPFSNVQPGNYWSGTEFAFSSTDSWLLNFSTSNSAAANKFLNLFVWAVRDGDIDGVVDPLPPEVGITCRDLGHFGVNECSVAELTSGGGRVFVLNVAMTVNTSPAEPENDRVKVTGFIEEGSNRPGLRFEVFEDALAVDVCHDLPLYSFGSFVFERSLAEPIEVTDATLNIDYSDVHTGSGGDFDGAFLYGFIMDAPFFTAAEEIGVDYFIPEAARDARNSEDNSFLDVFPPAEVLPVTLVFDPEKFDPMNPGRQDFRVDILQRAAPANSPLCGQITRVNGWTVTFGRAGDPDPVPQQVNITPLITPLLLR